MIGRIAAAAVVAAAIPLGLLALADYVGARQHGNAVSRAEWTLRRGDHLHYAVHLMTGRVLDLCPCTRNAARTQYYRARFHALTPNQRAAVAPRQAGAPPDWTGYAAGPLIVARDWVVEGVAWITG